MQRIERKFQLWEYWVSHSQLLLRSPKTPLNPTNVDIVFLGVQYVELSMSIDGLEIMESTPEERAKAVQAVGYDAPGTLVFVLASRGHRYLVVAGRMDVVENEQPIFEPALERF